MRVMLDTASPDHWKVKKLAKLLYGKRKNHAAIAWAAAFGHLCALWCRVMSRRENGNLRGWPGVELASAGLWPGESRVFLKALFQCKLVDRNKDGEYEIHDWVEHQGDIVAEREVERQRKAKWRAEQAKLRPASVPPSVPRDTEGCPVPPIPSVPSPPRPGPSGGGDASRPAGQDPPSASPPDDGAELSPGQQAIGFSAGTGAQAIAEILRRRGWDAASAGQRLEKAHVVIARLGLERAREFASTAKVGDVFGIAIAVDRWAEDQARAAAHRKAEIERRAAAGQVVSELPMRTLEELAAGDEKALKFLRLAGLAKKPPSGGTA